MLVIRQLKKNLLSNLMKHFLLHNATFLVPFYFYHNQNYSKLKIENKKLIKKLYVAVFDDYPVVTIIIFEQVYTPSSYNLTLISILSNSIKNYWFVKINTY